MVVGLVIVNLGYVTDSPVSTKDLVTSVLLMSYRGFIKPRLNCYLGSDEFRFSVRILLYFVPVCTTYGAWLYLGLTERKTFPSGSRTGCARDQQVNWPSTV